MKKQILFILAFLLTAGLWSASAQDKFQVRGTVLDENGESVIGAGVMEKGTTNGAITDIDGKYVLTVSSANAVLEVSFVGYTTETAAVGGRAVIDFTLKEDATVLNEVMVIGYGTVKKKDLTGAVANVDGTKVANMQSMSVAQAIQGTMPGVEVTRTSGLPGAGATIRVRGITTINNTSPLVVIDGIPMGGMSDVDSDAIESITVLKDAASAAIYGSRAAAGVILITTKRAKEGHLSVDYNGSYSMMTRTRHPDMVSATRFMELQNEAQWNDAGNTPGDDYFQYEKSLIDNYYANNALDPDSYPITDWDALCIDKWAPQTKHRLGVTYGNKIIKSRAMLSYSKADALYLGRDQEEYTARLNNDVRVNKFISVGLDLSYGRRNSHNNQINPIRAAHLYNPIYVSVWSDGTMGPGNNGTNTYARLHAGGFDNTWRNTFFGKASITITPFKDFTIQGVVSPGIHNVKEKSFIKQAYYYRQPGILSDTPLSGCTYNTLQETRGDGYEITKQVLLNYKKDFGKNHHTTYMAGYEDYTAFSESLTSGTDQMELGSFPYLVRGNKNFLSSTGDASENAYRSFFGRFTYDYKGRYLLQANARYDQSSRFASKYRGGFFPSVAVGWVVTEEPFFKNWNANFINFLKIRGSYGVLGNDRIGNYPWQSTMSHGNIVMVNPGTGALTSYMTAAQTNLAMEDLTWETTKTWNIGLDLTMFNSRLNFSGDIYRKNTFNMLMTREVPDVIGFGNPSDNIGDMHTNGWEFQVSWSDRKGDFSYSVSFNLSDYTSVMGDLGGYRSLGTNIIREGDEYNAFYGYRSTGIFQTQEEVDAAAKLYATVRPGDLGYKDLAGTFKTNKDFYGEGNVPAGLDPLAFYVDADGNRIEKPDGIINPEYDREVLGSSTPHYQYGGNIQLGWKGWDLSLAFQGLGKVNAWIGQEMVYRTSDAYNFPVEYANHYWSEYNTPEQNLTAKYPRATLTNSAKNNYEQMTDYWLINGAYFRLKNVMLSYTLPAKLTKKANIDKLRIWGSATDPFSIDNFPQGWDPEAYANLSAYMVRTFTLGLQVVFGGDTAVEAKPAKAVKTVAPEIREVVKEVVKEKVVEKPVEKIVKVEVPASSLKGAYEDDLFFVIGKAEIRPDEAFKLGQISQILKENPEAKIAITGYADSATGTAEGNRSLSAQRAKVVADMLIKAGIPASRITSAGTGTDKDASASPESNRVAVCIIK